MFYGAERVCRKTLAGAGLSEIVSTVAVGNFAAAAMVCACLCHFGSESFAEIRCRAKNASRAYTRRQAAH